MTFRFNTNKYSLPEEYVGKTVTVRARAHTVEAWHAGKLVYSHVRPYAKGGCQYIPDHYLTLLERKPRAIGNAAPLKIGKLPPELTVFRERCKARDKYEQLANVMLLTRDHGTEEVMRAVDCANRSGASTYKTVLFFLGLDNSIPDERGVAAYDNVVIEHADLRYYDELLLGISSDGGNDSGDDNDGGNNGDVGDKGRIGTHRKGAANDGTY
jgi:hypothetical protein